MHYFTSITTCYLPKARVLAATLKKTNPGAIMHLVIADDLPHDFNLENEDFDFVWKAEDFIHTDNNKKWFFQHTIVELCTAIKGAAALHILHSTSADKIVYLDPDIGVFGDLSPLSEMLDSHSVLLTPHQIAPATSLQGIKDEEICSLKHGVYNFGFFAVKNDLNGLQFLNWWNDRLMAFCYDDIPNGLFTDQKWGDIAPALFDFIKIVRDPEYNVATWNLATRTVTGNQDTGWFVNGRPLKFFHFSGFDSGDHKVMLAQHAKKGDPVWNLSLWYERTMNEKGQAELGKFPCKFAFYENGQRILNTHRKRYRERLDIYNHFDNPFCEECCQWMQANVSETDKDILTLVREFTKAKRIYKTSLFGRRKKWKQRYKRCLEELLRIQHK